MVLSKVTNKSAWEEGLSVLESVLEPGSKSDAALSEIQREGLKKLRHLMLSGGIGGGSGGGSAKAHIPQSLFQVVPSSSSSAKKKQEQPQQQDEQEEKQAEQPEQDQSQQSQEMVDLNASFNESVSDLQQYFLSEFAGLKRKGDAKKKFRAVIGAHAFLGRLRARSRSPSRSPTRRDYGTYTPPSFKKFSVEQQRAIATMLSWESLSHWAFNIFRLRELVGEDALVYMGWAILGSPYAQHAMEMAINGGDETDVTPLNNLVGYRFLEKYKIQETVLCEFLRAIQEDYKRVPFHNRYHASDVLQSLHALLVMSNHTQEEATPKSLWADSSPEGAMEVFAILVAAVIHDVGHPGYNNNFQVNSKSDLALIYNDRSVLENMHAARGFGFLMGKKKREETDILQNFSKDQAANIRSSIIKSVLQTDMTVHFEKISQIKGYVMEIQEKGGGTTTNGGGSGAAGSVTPSSLLWKGDALLLGFLLHAADISNPTKPPGISSQWADRCLEEFFLQGDKEKELGLPVSPLCDRNTTKRADSQIGFISFIILPTFEVLGQVIPEVAAQIVPRIHNNLEFWKKQKEIETKKAAEAAAAAKETNGGNAD